MKLTRIFPLSLVAIAIALPMSASAQDAENIYMRRPLPLHPTTTTQGFRWETTTTVTDLNGNPVDESNYCGPIQRRNTSICVANATGQRVGDSYCGVADRPRAIEEDYAGSACSFSWIVGAWDEGTARCTTSETQMRSVRCQNQDGVAVEDRFCTDAKPTTLRTVADYSGCTGSDPASTPTVRWGAWSYDRTCSATATKTRTGTCQVQGQNAPSSVCTDAGIPVSETIQEANFSGCSHAWQSEAWSSWSNTCGVGTRTRSVTCLRSDGAQVPETHCTANTKPTTSETTNVTSGCPNDQCYGTEKILTTENVMQDCQAFAAGMPSCPTGTTQGDPGAGTCVSRITTFSGDNCAVRGFESSAASCDAGSGSGTGSGTNSCRDECGEERQHGMKWCTAGARGLSRRTSECKNGTVTYASTISGLGCDSGGVYQCP